jgi:hypothetical protein
LIILPCPFSVCLSCSLPAVFVETAGRKTRPLGLDIPNFAVRKFERLAGIDASGPKKADLDFAPSTCNGGRRE